MANKKREVAERGTIGQSRWRQRDGDARVKTKTERSGWQEAEEGMVTLAREARKWSRKWEKSGVILSQERDTT